jgi:8-oxo-dGTP pyrophosphatase MutT (NUDIX family)
MRQTLFASCVFFTRDKRILLQDREGISKFGEEWSFFGGKVEPGEPIEEAVVREIKEELNHELEHHTYIGHLTHRDPDGGKAEVHYFIKEIEHLNDFTVLEGGGMRLFTLDEAKALNMMPGSDVTLQMLEENL